MADDAYEFLSPDLLAPPPPVNVPAAGGAPVNEAPQTPVNELAPVSAAEKFQVQPALATKDSKSKSKSRESGKPKKKKTKRSTGSRSHESSEPLPSLSSFKWQMIFSAVLVFASVAITLMVLVDGLM
ncbi:hypothetical protein L5515_000574 [Caenorhabditis briggsae]|uniref:Transmembrane protein n=1 Tax=Caenorhabditis briggsae TaxID=6238 RepID=A0AAE9IY65_CAEBR|nr:hypothetical protein L3Y34_014494 [Caenorhabditis briggsae]UMM11145.1 hypothetical protein L5515_000574 [Caenorhabditis briggsae]